MRLVDVVFSTEVSDPNFNTSSPIHRDISPHMLSLRYCTFYVLQLPTHGCLSSFLWRLIVGSEYLQYSASFSGQHPTTIPRSQPYDGTLVCTPSRSSHTGIANQIFLWRPRVPSRGHHLGLIGSLERHLVQPSKKNHNSRPRHGKRDARSGTSHMRRPKPGIERVQLAEMMMRHLVVLQGFRGAALRLQDFRKGCRSHPHSRPHLKPIIAIFSILSLLSKTVVGGYLICCSSHASHPPCHSQ